jgi:hypothetical protein
MATKADRGVSRRGFIGAIGAAAAATALPAVASVAPSFTARADGLRAASFTARGDGLRAAYFAELVPFAETLRPRFESGELRAFCDCDDPDESPMSVLERLCADRFGLHVTRRTNGYGYEKFDGDDAAAYLILAASPHAEATDDHQNHPAYHAVDAVLWDVITLARERGWYTPTIEECEDPAISEECELCGHLLSAHGDGVAEPAGCCLSDCDCSIRHKRHVRGVLA